MPRENIYIEGGDWKVSVGWDKQHAEAQIATLNGAYSEDSAEAGWFIEVKRDDINNLIHLLRKARDGAFGADA